MHYIKFFNIQKAFFICGLAFLFGCASSQKSGSAKTAAGDTRTKKVEFLNDNTYYLTEASNDKTYGYNQANPIKVGGSKESSGPRNQRRFLNGLLGPNGEEIKYYRAGSCCAFKTPNGPFDNTGLLDLYRVYWEGSSDTLNIYINLYDKGNLLIPVGLTAKEK
ncbi:hypothetical protein Q0590_31470 [Rhodocytophaga aerolata]|uniref:2-dehydro-3-deoxyphosphooctonate aldolase n=1 Tax=Rhodocytophaga aerolata TaxID=455078 RepID=A0ABT8RGK9_9BACT|nr:hypothetical protein [Rhodocytophaga aerolata]MDO1450836.1 hypothetical protein [Rhodocytophaga aerolata]